MTITASKVHLARECTAAFVLPHTIEVHAGQEDGEDRHVDLEAAIDTGVIPDVIAKRWPGYTWRSEVAFVVDLATDEGREIGQSIQRDYGDLGVFAIAGTADIVGRGPNCELVIVDRKSFDPNVPRAAVNAQLHTLALAACRAYRVDSAEVAIWHEVRPLDVASVDVLDLDIYAANLRTVIGRVAKAKAAYRRGIVNTNPGAHCRWCPSFHDCPEQRDLAVEADRSLPMRIEQQMPFRNDQEAADAFDLLGRIEMLTKRIRGALYARGAERPIPLNDGRVLGPVEKLAATEIDIDKGHRLLLDKFGPQIANDCLTKTLSQAGIERALKRHGHGGLMKDVKKALTDSGAAKREMKTSVEVHEVKS